MEDIGAGESTRGISDGRFGEISRSPQISHEFSEGWLRNVHLGQANVASPSLAFEGANVRLEANADSPPLEYSVDSEESGVGDRGGCWKVESSSVVGGRMPHARQGGIEAAAVICGA